MTHICPDWSYIYIETERERRKKMRSMLIRPFVYKDKTSIQQMRMYVILKTKLAFSYNTVWSHTEDVEYCTTNQHHAGSHRDFSFVFHLLQRVQIILRCGKMNNVFISMYKCRRPADIVQATKMRGWETGLANSVSVRNGDVYWMDMYAYQYLFITRMKNCVPFFFKYSH